MATARFTFVTKTPPNSYFLKKAAGIEKGSQTAGKGATVGRVTMAQIREIAEKKMADLNAKDSTAACRMLIGSARSMGLEVVGVGEQRDGKAGKRLNKAYEGIDPTRRRSRSTRR